MAGSCVDLDWAARPKCRDRKAYWGLGVSRCVRSVCPTRQEVDVDTRVVRYVENLSPLITWWNLSERAKDKPRLSHSQKISQRGSDRESLLSVLPKTQDIDWSTSLVTLQPLSRHKKQVVYILDIINYNIVLVIIIKCKNTKWQPALVILYLNCTLIKVFSITACFRQLNDNEHLNT